MYQGSKSFNNEDCYVYQRFQKAENYLYGTKYFNQLLIQHSKSLTTATELFLASTKRHFKR